MNKPRTLINYLKIKLSIVFVAITLLVITLLIHNHYLALDDATEYYMHYDGEVLSKAYKPGDNIIEFDQGVKEYYFSVTELPASLQTKRPFPVNTLTIVEHQQQVIYIYPYQAIPTATPFYVLHYFIADDLNSLTVWVIVGCLLGLVALLTFLQHISNFIAHQLCLTTPWISQLAESAKPIALPNNLIFNEIIEPLNALNHIKQYNADLVQQQQTSLHHQQTLVQFLAHELRTPIAVQQAAFSRLAQLDDITEPVLNAIAKAHCANNQMQHLSQGLLLLWQTESLPTTRFNLVPLLNQSQMQLAEAGYSIALNIKPTAEPCYINSNQQLWLLLINNVLQNAAKYSALQSADVNLTSDSICFTNTPEINNNLPQGHGVGLFIIQQIANRLDLTLTIKQQSDQFSLTVNWAKK